MASLVGAAACGLTATAASASSDQTTVFNVQPQRTQDALLNVAVQARVSMGGDLERCRGRSSRLTGRMTLEAALRRVLRDSGCRFVVRRDGAVYIQAFEPAPAAGPVASPPATIDVETQLEEVIVTASRRPEEIQRSSVVVTAMRSDQMALAGATDINALEALVVGMNVTNLGPGRNKIFLRGLSDGAFTGLTQSTVGLYLDQVPITYNAPNPDLKLVDIDRVEVARGPQGTLYGTGPMSGVVRIITRLPDLTESSLDVSATGSRTHYGGTNTDFSATGNLAFAQGRAAVRGVVYQEAFSGYINDVNLNLRRINEGRRQGGRLALSVQLTPDWTVTASGLHQTIETEDTHYVYRTINGVRRSNLVREPHRNTFDEAAISVAGGGAWGELNGSLAYIRHSFESRYDASSALRRFGSFAQQGALDETKDIRLLVGEATLNSTGSNRLRWTAGVMASLNETRSNATLLVLRTTELPIYSEDRVDRLAEVALFGEASYDLTPDVTMVAGARAYGLAFSTDSRVVQRTRVRTFDGRDAAGGISPKLAVLWHLNEELSLSAQISQGHRAGGFNTAGIVGGGGVPELDPETRAYGGDTLWNYELGARTTFWGGRAVVRAAAFYSTWKNIQSDQFLPSGLGYVVNIGDGETVGLEVETAIRPFQDLEIRGNALLAGSAVTRTEANFNVAHAANLPSVPRSSANLSAVWRRPMGGDLMLVSAGNVAYVGPSHLTFDIPSSHPMGGYAFARIAMGVEGDRWSAVAFIDNLFDTEANTFAYSDPFRLPDAQAVTPLRPRTIGLSLRWAH